MDNVGTLYIVATPIGNLDDISLRALKILQAVDVVAAEDTRHSKKLLESHQINTPMLALHEHNEVARAQTLLNRVGNGENIALISDAGTPLISDPGYVLVRQAREQGVPVVPVPGACAAITALSASGLPTDRFMFVGFLPQKTGPRSQALQKALAETATLVFYESPRRILDLLKLLDEMAGDRSVCLAKELTKTFERFFSGMPAQLLEQLKADSDLQRGEWVVLVGPAPDREDEDVDISTIEAVEVAAKELPLKKACEVVAKITGQKKNKLYQAVLAYRNE